MLVHMAPRSLLAAPFRFNQSNGCDNGVDGTKTAFSPGEKKAEDFV
jgi:hypothetical protein